MLIRTKTGQVIALDLKEMEGITFGGMLMDIHLGKERALSFFSVVFGGPVFMLNHFCNFICHDSVTSRLKAVAATITQPVSNKITGGT